ncbi:MAG: hypothetical protein NC433_17975 [Clostridiales bacterium]|nr:hypothetical protein [Clostridiales bacterium]
MVNAGGGFMYVGAMHDSFPHALELSKMGYNGFALIYRPDDPYTDLAQAISFIYDNAKELEVSPEDYSLWGGSAGARMAATLGNENYLRCIATEQIFRQRQPSLCSIPDMRRYLKKMRRPMCVSAPVPALRIGKPCSPDYRTLRHSAFLRSSMSMKGFRTASVSEPARQQKGGLTTQWHFGRHSAGKIDNN